jgi:hypothetical protein
LVDEPCGFILEIAAELVGENRELRNRLLECVAVVGGVVRTKAVPPKNL